MNRKIFIISLKFIVIIAIIIGFILINEMITDNRKEKFIPVGDGCEYAYQFEDIEIKGKDLLIKGWFFELRNTRSIVKNIQDNKRMGIVLYDLGEGEKIEGECSGIICKMTYNTREDVNNYFKCEYDYSDCGFSAIVDLSKVELNEKKYRIIIKPEYDGEYGIITNTYIYNGKLSYINPSDMMSIDAMGTDLEKIVDNGICLSSYPEYHVCIFQYNDEIYWIADELYNFDLNGNNDLEYMLDTTQFDKLPESRIRNGWYWDNKGSTFESSEITDKLTCGKYRVCVKKIPLEYAIVGIESGCYTGGEWIWHSFFRPIYKDLVY